jgi:hypothetical protein
LESHQENASSLPTDQEKCELLLADLAEAALRLNAEPDLLARVLASRAKPVDGLGSSTDGTFRVFEKRLGAAARELAENRHALEALRNSWSWRVTAPLRALVVWGRVFYRVFRCRPRHLAGFIQWAKYGRSIRASRLFDDRYYLIQHPDVAQAGLNPLLHYCVFGARENRWPNCLFDGEYYCQSNLAVAGSRENPLVHYLKRGAYEGCNPHPQFDSTYYLTQYPESRQEGWNPLAHFLGPGIVEGCNPNSRFDTLACLQQNPELAALGVNPVLYYLAHNPYVLGRNSDL